jgi:phosphoenolpyruvate carboxykinase (GTP)
MCFLLSVVLGEKEEVDSRGGPAIAGRQGVGKRQRDRAIAWLRMCERAGTFVRDLTLLQPWRMRVMAVVPLYDQKKPPSQIFLTNSLERKTMASLASSIPTTNKHLIRWVEKMADLCQPARIHWVDGSQEEYDALCDGLVKAGTFTRLNEKLWPGCFYARSAPNDVARVEDRTFICSLSKDNAGPTNNWEDPFAMRKKLKHLFSGCMKGRTMYVLPFSMGPIGSPISQIGVELTDSAYVVVNMRIMARVGAPVFAEIDKGSTRVVPCMHSVGAPLEPGDKDVAWPCNDTKYIVHFPEPREI